MIVSVWLSFFQAKEVCWRGFLGFHQPKDLSVRQCYADDYFGGTDEAQELDADPMLKSDTLESGQDFFNDDKQPEIEAGSGMTVEHESNDQNYQIQEGNDQNYEAPGEPTWAGGYTQAMVSSVI